MKKTIIIICILNIFTFTVFAQLDRRNFMDEIDLDAAIEKGDYTVNSTFKANQWNLSNVANNQAGASPIAVAPLFYDGYIESGRTNAFKLEKLESGARLSTYSMNQETAALENYASGIFYLALMINVDSVSTTEGVGIINLDGSVLGNYRRTCLYVKNLGKEDDDDDTEANITFGIAFQEQQPATSKPIFVNESYTMGTTYLIVIKHDFGKAPNEEEISLFVNPDLEAAEEPIALVVDVPSTQPILKHKGIRAITVRQRTNYSATLGGLRLAKSWKDAVGEIKNSVEAVYDSKVISIEYYSLAGYKVAYPIKDNIYLTKTTYENNTIKWDKQLFIHQP